MDNVHKLMTEFLERPEVYTTIVWGTFAVLTLGIIGWFWVSNRRQHRKDAARGRLGEKVPERTFLSVPEVGELTPGMKLFLHIAGLIVIPLAGYWVCRHSAKQFSDLESGKVPSIKVDSVTAWAYDTLGASGALGLMAGLFITVLLVLCDDTRDAYRAFRASRQGRNKGDKKNP